MSNLRRKAETRLKLAPPLARATPAGRTPDEIAHELDVRDAELQLQDEQLRRLRAEFEASRRRYEAVMDASKLAYLTVDRDGRILEANAAASALFGVEPNVLVHKPLSAFMDATDADAFRLFREQVERDGAKRSGEILVHGKGRAARPVKLTATFVSHRRRGRGDAFVCVLNERVPSNTAPKPEAQPPADWSELLQGIVSCTSLALETKLSAEHVRELAARARDMALRGLGQRFDERHTTSPPRLRGTVLIVEEDPLVRDALREQLVDLGLAVVEAPDAENAAKLVDRTTPDLVIANARLSHTTGAMLVERMRARRPDVPVLFVSDGAADLLEAALTAPRTRFLRRPYAEEALAADVEALLAPPRRASRPSQRIATATAPTAKIRRRQADGTMSDFAFRGYSPRAVAGQVMRALEEAEQERGRGIWSTADPEVWIGDAMIGRLSSEADAARLADAVLARLEADGPKRIG